MKKNETYHDLAGQDTPKKKLKCIFVHGWGMNRVIWQPVINSLPDWIEPVLVDLPGHGQRTSESFTSLAELAGSLQSYAEEPALWVGWSLGGMAVTQLALDCPEKVAAMLLVSNSPCFVKRDDWQAGMEAEVFDTFAADLENDFAITIQRFLSLQVRGSESGRNLLRHLRKEILAQPPANINALRSGLQLLKTVDLRGAMHTLCMPTQWVLGERDTLVDVTLANELADIMPRSAVHVVVNTGHAPFLSHLDEFSEQLISFAKLIHEPLCD
ncbi:MAG TPA: pimeloyl-ACP methyl ester esterase BioH [Gammaproteobacteria bacterium]